MDTIEFKVKSEMYGVTDCVVNIESFLKGRRTFPCGDGCDHTLTILECSKVMREVSKRERENRK